MRWLWRLLLVLALASTGALLYQHLAVDPGTVQLTWRGWVVESTVVVLAVGVTLSVLLLLLLLWLARLPLRLWRRRRQRQARERLADGLMALHEGRWGRAEKQLVLAARDRALRLPALLQAARAAEARGDGARAQQLLARAGEADGESALLLIGVERLLDEGRAALACERLEAAASRGALPPRGIELRLRALAACGRADEALGLLASARRAHALDNAAFEALERSLAAAALGESHAADDLQRRWRALSKPLRLQPQVVDAYAARGAALGLDEDVAAAIELALKRQWDERLAARYGSIASDHPARRIGRAEEWLQDHPDSAGLLIALGHLCRLEKLWGKAEDYLERALTHGGGATAWEEMAALHADRGDESRARRALQNALRAGRGEAPLALPGRSLLRPVVLPDEREERDAHGMPRLSQQG